MTAGSVRGVFGGGVKSVQRGTFSTTVANAETRITIAPVNPAKTFLKLGSGGGGNRGTAILRLIDSTGLGVVSNDAENTNLIHWEVVEFY